MRRPLEQANVARHYRRVAHLACRRVLDETIVLNLRGRVALGLDDCGAWLLEQLAQPRRAGDLATALGAGVEEIESFLDTLQELGVIEAAPPTACEPPAAVGRSGRPAVLWRERMEAVAGATPSNLPGDVDCGF